KLFFPNPLFEGSSFSLFLLSLSFPRCFTQSSKQYLILLKMKIFPCFLNQPMEMVSLNVLGTIQSSAASSDSLI
ncbi:hypothetical protein A4A49_52862, partial [Nicotiana attenuata]